MTLGQCDRRVQDFHAQIPTSRNVKVWHVARMSAVSPFESVLLAAGVEVVSGCGKGRFAFSHRVDMKRMFPAGRPFTSSLMRTPLMVWTKFTFPTAFPQASLSVALATCAAAD
jgi:hypothetical protein